MGGFVNMDGPGPKLVTVKFPRLGAFCEVQMDLGEGGITFTFTGKVPGQLKEGESFVFDPDEDQTWWMQVTSPLSNLRTTKKFSARVTISRIHGEVEHLTGDVHKAMEKLGSDLFPSSSPLVVTDRLSPTRGQVTLTVTANSIPKAFRAQRVGKQIREVILTGLPQEREWKHPGVSLSQTCTPVDANGQATLKLVASIC